jgi:hypothetical protein
VPPSPLQDRIGDEIQRCFRQSDLLAVATRFDAEMHGCHGINLDSHALWAEVSGTLNLSHDETNTHKIARCRIRVSPNWNSESPIVRCCEAWVHRDWDWHAGAGGLLCYIIDEQWADSVGKVLADEGADAAARYAVGLCLRNVRWLLYRHYVASITRMTVWPKQWKAWSHGDVGLREYHQERGRQRNE